MKVLFSSPIAIRFVADRTESPPEGLLVRKPGAPGCLILNGRVVSRKQERVIQPGAEIALITPGGRGGWAAYWRGTSTWCD
jgi:hypothetical protein